MDSTDKKTLRPRQRENRYSAQITARIPDALKARLEAVAGSLTGETTKN